MPNILLDLIEGKVFCSKCINYVKPQYIRDSANICRCSICHTLIRAGSVRRKYEKGLRWCTICQEFRKSWEKRFGWCEDCHTKLRFHSYTRMAKAKRELTLVRY